LPKPIAELKEKDLSIPRNPVLSKLFRMVKLAENVGFGFDKIESNWLQYTGSTPEYILDFDSVISKIFLDTKGKTEQVTEQVSILIQAMDYRYYSTAELRALIGIVHKPTFLYKYLQPSLSVQLIEMSQPDSPKSPKQRYRLTEEGKKFKREISS
jgi:ATP-dependent DNA helicase RecG